MTRGRVLFLLRADAESKPGGDSAKVSRYVDRLTELGWACTTSTDSSSIAGSHPDIVHLMNLDLPRENLAYADVARAFGAKLVLSTIRHPFEGVRAMHRFGQDAFYLQARRIGLGPEASVGLKERVKLARSGNYSAAARRGRYLALQESLLKQVDAILPMAEGELAAIEADFSVNTTSSIVKNGMSFTAASLDLLEVEANYDMVTIGRIEPRKNTLELARSAHAHQIRAVFAGTINDNHSDYGHEFVKLAESSAYVDYVGQVGRDDLRKLLVSARCYVNPAWFEVVSQADCEAAALGIPVVTTKYSYIGDILGQVPKLDPAQIAAQPSCLPEILARARVVATPSDQPWSAAGDALNGIYSDILAGQA